MNSKSRWACLVLAAAALFSTPARAQVVPEPAPASGPLPGAPARGAGAPGILSSRDLWLGIVFFGSLASAEIEGIDGAFGSRPESRDFAYRRIPRTLGRLEVGAGLAGVTWLAGSLAGSETAVRVGVRSLETLLVNTALTTTFKVGLGRARPDTGVDADHFDILAWGRDNWSFPSGHTSNMFALATTVSRELRDEAPWVPFVAYPLAGLTGASRVLDRKHWFTDVVAGAALGIFSSHLVARFHDEGDPARSVSGPSLLLSTTEPFAFGLSFRTR